VVGDGDSEEQQEWKEYCGEMYGEERLEVGAVM